MGSASTDQFVIGTDYTNGELSFRTGANATRMTIDSSGNVGIADTTPDFRFEINGTSTSGYFGITNSSDGDIFTINGSGNISTGVWEGTAIGTAFLNSAVILSTEIDTSSEIAAIVGDETGSGLLVFGTSPTFTTDITFPALSIEAGSYGAATIDGDDVASGIAGRSLTLTSASPDTLDIDSEIYTHSDCKFIENPTAADDFKSLWRFTQAVTITEIWAESDQTVTFNLQEDDGSPANIMNFSLVPAAGETATTTFSDSAIAEDSEIDLVTVSVASTPTYVDICIEYTVND